ncbi:hypothetical protein PPROV_000693000 [Pycnococcus provasolii]|uniref:tRNA (guanine(46)-N(7))-methyltransferase n=1 Tax=Pycnococcus provasolii TaxID=41880 RepID=A0A830HT97_9CHLO|nr:hypothetical protein PPROV_000693000 [Pycnococcus provasolii]
MSSSSSSSQLCAQLRTCARHKNLKQAQDIFTAYLHGSISLPSPSASASASASATNTQLCQAYAAMINVFASCGRLDDARALSTEMWRKLLGRPLDVMADGDSDAPGTTRKMLPQTYHFAFIVTCTSLLKALGTSSSPGAHEFARNILLCAHRNAVTLDARIVSAFLRASLWANESRLKYTVKALQHTHTDLAGRRLLGAMLMRASRVGELRALCTLAHTELQEERDYRSTVRGGVEAALQATGGKYANIAKLVTHAPSGRSSQECLFYARGYCERGIGCTFVHDASAGRRQRDRKAVLLEQAYTTWELHVKLALTLTLLGRRGPAMRALETCDSIAASVSASTSEHHGAHGNEQHHYDEGDAGDGEEGSASFSSAAFRRTKHEELILEMKRVRRAWESKVKPKLSRLGAYVDAAKRTFFFDQRVSKQKRSVAAAAMSRAWRRGFGISAVARRGFAHALGGDNKDGDKSTSAAIAALREEYRRRLTRDGRIDWTKVFGPSSDVHLEIACGSGEWAAAQARAHDARSSQACWVCMELRPDRVHRCFAHAALERLSNLAVLAGDARDVLASRVPHHSVHRIFVRFPEPPHRRDHDAASNDAALLTDEFWRACWKALRKNDGVLVVYGDNHPYLETLANDLEKQEHSNTSKRARISRRMWHDAVDGSNLSLAVAVREGTPGEDLGEMAVPQDEDAMSLFDRFWNNGAHSGRWHVAVTPAHAEEEQGEECSEPKRRKAR